MYGQLIGCHLSINDPTRQGRASDDEWAEHRQFTRLDGNVKIAERGSLLIPLAAAVSAICQ